MKRAFRRPLAALALVGLVFAASCSRAVSPSPPRRTFLQDGWTAYKKLYLSEPGNVLDRTRNGGETTSEGQSYLLLRAAWLGDEPAFARAFDWTETHLRRSDGLFSWRWTPNDGGRVLDENTASDADQDIAFALIVASHAFKRPMYLERARELVRAIRTVERLDLPGGWTPAAGNWAVRERIMNLSYFLPYAYPYFARLDPEGQWPEALSTGYDLMLRTRQIAGFRLFPDFQHVRADGSIALLPAGGQLSSDFSFDAMRIFWRVAMDCQLHQRMRACADPADARGIEALLARDGAVFTRYRIDGTVVDRDESLSFYGGILPALTALGSPAAAAIRDSRLSPSALADLLSRSNRYYDANWVWFGIAAADGYLAAQTPRPEILIP